VAPIWGKLVQNRAYRKTLIVAQNVPDGPPSGRFSQQYQLFEFFMNMAWLESDLPQ
jgi:hypothetical protein